MVNTGLIKNLDNVNFYKKGTVIFAEGLASKNLYMVKSGNVRLLKFKNNKLLSMGICREKDILNEVSVLTKTKNVISAIAETDVELVLVQEKDIHKVIASGPQWVEELFNTLCERLESVQEVIEEHQMKDSFEDKDLILTKEQEMEYTAAIRSFKADK